MGEIAIEKERLLYLSKYLKKTLILKKIIMSSGKVILGAIAGLATGAILGILFAPEKGTDTRKKIARKGKESIDDMKSKYEDVIASLSSKLESVKKDASHLFEEGKDLAHDAKREASKLSEAGKSLAHEAKVRAENQL
mgnify:CR=1 FL=1